jgi:hypothetical protein
LGGFPTGGGNSKRQGQTGILAFVEDKEVIEKIFKYLGLWDLKVSTPPKGEATLRNDFHQ